MAIYYLSDMHLHHRSLALRRGFPSAQEHDRTLLENLRRRVGNNDTLFLLGDLFAYDYSDVLLRWLQDVCWRTVLIQGNHETNHWLHKASPRLLSQVFTDILEEAEVMDGERLVRMCHEPRPDLYDEDEKAYLLYGHLHDQPPRREDWKALCAKPHALNVSAEIGAYTTGHWGEPGTLDQWVFFNEVWKSKATLG